MNHARHCSSSADLAGWLRLSIFFGGGCRMRRWQLVLRIARAGHDVGHEQRRVAPRADVGRQRLLAVNAGPPIGRLRRHGILVAARAAAGGVTGPPVNTVRPAVAQRTAARRRGRNLAIGRWLGERYGAPAGKSSSPGAAAWVQATDSTAAKNSTKADIFCIAITPCPKSMPRQCDVVWAFIVARACAAFDQPLSGGTLGHAGAASGGSFRRCRFRRLGRGRVLLNIGYPIRFLIGQRDSSSPGLAAGFRRPEGSQCLTRRRGSGPRPGPGGSTPSPLHNRSARP